MTEEVLVIGAGIAGLSAALALAPTGRAVTLLERDDPPPGRDLDAAFLDWRRRGVGHLRHSHAFLARLRAIIKTEHPRLLEALLESGVREFPFEGSLSNLQRETYAPDPADSELTIISSRRTTLERIMRDYVETLPNLTIRSGFMVRALILEKRGPLLDVRGITGEDANGAQALRADFVIDCGGRIGAAFEQIIEAGAPIREENESAGILYFTRHYRLEPGQQEPPRIGAPPATGDLGFLKFGVFPADNNHFSITIAVPEIEGELRKAIVDPEIFQSISQALPGTRPWTAPTRAAPASKVFGMGDLQSRWRDFAPDGAPAILNFFALGDSHVRTNPLYGRGCSFAAIGAYLLRDALAATQDPAARLIAYEAALRAELHPFYAAMLKQDRGAVRRARQALTPSYRPSLRARILRSFLEDGITIALRSDVGLLREAMRAFHMLDPPDAWIKRPANLLRILAYWARGPKKNAAAYPPKAGPERDDLFAVLGLDPQADIALAAAPSAA